MAMAGRDQEAKARSYGVACGWNSGQFIAISPFLLLLVSHYSSLRQPSYVSM